VRQTRLRAKERLSTLDPGETTMSDGREEREEREKRLEEERKKDREDRLSREVPDEWEPERGGS
jgi:hypothetical protein